ncbi:MAG TPA: CpaF family protein [Longimicrobiales bacterium]|nr:CpaF family protein [Longimicrobiales bacterium]
MDDLDHLFDSKPGGPPNGSKPPDAEPGWLDSPTERPGGEAPGDGWGSFQASTLLDIKSRVHRKVLERLNLSNLEQVEREEAGAAIRRVVQDLLAQEQVALNMDERESVVRSILDEIFGLGPLEPLMHDAEISDILVNAAGQVFIERNGVLEATTVRFKDDRHLLQVIDRIVSAVGRRIDDSSPMVDARLPDGSRVNAIIPPLAIDGPHMSIRKFRRDTLSGADLIRNNTLTEKMLQLLEGCVKARMNVLISGGTGAGKTTLLNVLSSYISQNERIVTIEDSAELQLRQPHVVRLETRPPNIEGHGEVSQRNLLVNSLRMRPDRIVVGEVRASEAIDMLQAMNTGHDGSLTTLHANTPRDALARLETMVSMANLNLPDKAVRQQIASAIQVVIQVSRLSDGTRKVLTVAEIVGMEGDVITMQDIFIFDRSGVGEGGRVLGEFRPTGIRPRFADRLARYGVKLDSLLFSGNATDTEAGGW